MEMKGLGVSLRVPDWEADFKRRRFGDEAGRCSALNPPRVIYDVCISSVPFSNSHSSSSPSSSLPRMDPSSSSSLSSSTRISATTKPSARRRQSPQSTSTTPKPTQNAVASSSRQTHSIQPCPQDQIPQFPPPDVMLHRDDAGSKVFLAIARSLLSVVCAHHS